MRIAKDGKPFDIDNLGDLVEGEVEIIQYIRPNGRRMRIAAMIGKENVLKAKDLVISTEELRTGSVAIYVRHVDESEEDEDVQLAYNGPGKNSPNNVLIRMINKRERRDE